jgi:hypothetical protein
MYRILAQALLGSIEIHVLRVEERNFVAHRSTDVAGAKLQELGSLKAILPR